MYFRAWQKLYVLETPSSLRINPYDRIYGDNFSSAIHIPNNESSSIKSHTALPKKANWPPPPAANLMVAGCGLGSLRETPGGKAA